MVWCTEPRTKRRVQIKSAVCKCVLLGFSDLLIDDYILTADEIVALKRLKMEKEKEGFPITSLREINTILKAQHPNIVTVRVSDLLTKSTQVFEVDLILLFLLRHIIRR